VGERRLRLPSQSIRINKEREIDHDHG
jgi:hypothetical protein